MSHTEKAFQNRKRRQTCETKHLISVFWRKTQLFWMEQIQTSVSLISSDWRIPQKRTNVNTVSLIPIQELVFRKFRGIVISARIKVHIQQQQKYDNNFQSKNVGKVTRGKKQCLSKSSCTNQQRFWQAVFCFENMHVSLKIVRT